MITDFNDSAARLSSGDDFKHTTNAAYGENNNRKPKPTIVTSTENNRSKPKCSEVETSKKSVSFADNLSVYPLDAPCASDISSEEKKAKWYASDISSEEKKAKWYDPSEFDEFKHEAAKEAGVKIIRCDKVGRFAMVGDFDQKTDGGVASSSSENVAKKLYYNENEYGDSCDQNGGTICKRGLGYHFSRNRKKSRAVARSAVLAWQKMLLDPTNPTNPKLKQSLPALGGKLGGIEKAQVMMALVSAKCSRIAREEARWRGDVDCRVAYPERHAPTARATAATSAFGKDKKDDSACIRPGPLKKRMCHDADGTSSLSDIRCKRQRTSSGGCCGVGDGLSPSPIGMLRAEV